MRYEIVSRRALLKASAGLGVALVLPAACGNDDAQVFAGAVTDSAASGVVDAALPTTAPLTQDALPTAAPQAPPVAAEPDPTAAPDPTAIPEPTATAVPVVAVAGEMIVSFTYTQAAGGRNERPYIAVWIENQAGELVETVSLWYQQERRGARWLDHLDLWWELDQSRIFGGGLDDAATISSATRQPGSYAVAWDGAADGVAVAPGNYHLCIEAARELGPHSLIRQALILTGTLPQTPLSSDGELSAASVRIDV